MKIEPYSTVIRVSCADAATRDAIVARLTRTRSTTVGTEGLGAADLYVTRLYAARSPQEACDNAQQWLSRKIKPWMGDIIHLQRSSARTRRGRGPSELPHERWDDEPISGAAPHQPPPAGGDDGAGVREPRNPPRPPGSESLRLEAPNDPGGDPFEDLTRGTWVNSQDSDLPGAP